MPLGMVSFDLLLLKVGGDLAFPTLVARPCCIPWSFELKIFGHSLVAAYDRIWFDFERFVTVLDV